ncbi:MAG TPA: PTS sugar transporter subunit IIA [Candidatus Eisenbacteria bacterium]|jgi:PTS system nitrogen regulatory IIA component
MELRVRDVARLLNVSEDTVYQWAREGTLPVHRVGEQFRFNRVELQEWAATHGQPVSPRLFASPDPAAALPSLHDALRRGGITFDVEGSRRDQVLAAVARLPGIPPSVDRALLEQLLIGRESLAPTAVGGGIALPHPRDPLVVRVDEPLVLLCFLRHPVDFHAMDRQPVRVLFTLLSPSVRMHLQMLAKLAFVLHDEALVRLLGTRPTPDAVLQRVRELEAEFSPSGSGESSGRRGGA